MGSENHFSNQVNVPDFHKEQTGKGQDSCPDLGIKFDRSALNSVQLEKLDRNGKETVLTVTEAFAGNLPAAQKELFQKSITDAMTDKVGSLAKLALPENSKAANAFMEMMNNAGFNISIEHAKSGTTETHSLNIFEQDSKEGFRLNSVQSASGKRPEFCQTPDPISRSNDGRTITSSADFQSLISTQKALSDRVKNFLDRE